MADEDLRLVPIGRVASALRTREEAPRQADEGAPPAEIVVEPAFVEGLRELRGGDRIVVLTWLHLAARDVLEVHPRGDPSRAAQGVFTTRSADRPNPIGLHEVTVESVDGARLTVTGLEAVDGTPVLDLKPVLEPVADR
jgi:tRNA-Thr(GGU) m(6)t(6)A37 methyltransferase TsaA